MYHEDEETPVSKFADFKLQPLFCFRLGRWWLPPSFQQARGPLVVVGTWEDMVPIEIIEA